MSALAGAIDQRIAIQARGDARDAGGGATGGWTTIAETWAALAPDGVEDAPGRARPRWRVTMRARALPNEQRILWDGRVLRVAHVVADPRTRDRIVAHCVEQA